jgi:hypothetical protein
LDTLIELVGTNEFVASCVSIGNAIGEFVLTPERRASFCLSTEQRPTCFITSSCASSRGMACGLLSPSSDKIEWLGTLQTDRLADDEMMVRRDFRD